MVALSSIIGALAAASAATAASIPRQAPSLLGATAESADTTQPSLMETDPSDTTIPTPTPAAALSLETPDTTASAVAVAAQIEPELPIPTTTLTPPAAAVPTEQPNVTAPSADSILNNGTAPDANAGANAALNVQVNPIDWQSSLQDLVSSGISSVFSGDPSGIIISGLKVLISLFGMPAGSNGSGPTLQQFQQDVDSRLVLLGQDIAMVESTLQTVLAISTQIEIDVQELKLQEILESMIPYYTTIDTAFTTYVSAAQVIASNTSTPDQKAQAYSMMFTVLSNDATVGALAVYNAIMDYQRMSLDFGGGQGVLSMMPELVSTAHTNCALNLPKNAQDQSSNAAIWASYPTADSAYGPYYDSVDYIFRQCVNSTYTELQDPTVPGRNVQSIYGTIIATQIKAMVLLTTAFASPSDLTDTKLVQNVMDNAKQIGQQMASFWPSTASNATVDSLASANLFAHGAQLGQTRADNYWFDGDLSTHSNDPNFKLRPTDGSITPQMITFIEKTPWGGFSAAFIQPSSLTFDPTADTLTTPVVVFYPIRHYFTTALSTSVLAPFCWCGNEECQNAGYDTWQSVCANDLGAGYTYFAMSGSDHKGNSCWTGSVPICKKDTGNLEEYYYSAQTYAIPAPHTFLPPSPPQFIQDVMSAYGANTTATASLL